MINEEGDVSVVIPDASGRHTLQLDDICLFSDRSYNGGTQWNLGRIEAFDVSCRSLPSSLSNRRYSLREKRRKRLHTSHPTGSEATVVSETQTPYEYPMSTNSIMPDDIDDKMDISTDEDDDKHKSDVGSPISSEATPSGNDVNVSFGANSSDDADSSDDSNLSDGVDSSGVTVLVSYAAPLRNRLLRCRYIRGDPYSCPFKTKCRYNHGRWKSYNDIYKILWDPLESLEANMKILCRQGSSSIWCPAVCLSVERSNYSAILELLSDDAHSSVGEIVSNDTRHHIDVVSQFGSGCLNSTSDNDVVVKERGNSVCGRGEPSAPDCKKPTVVCSFNNILPSVAECLKLLQINDSLQIHSEVEVGLSDSPYTYSDDDSGEIAESSFAGLKKKFQQTNCPEEFAVWEKHTKGIGSAIMRQMGYKMGDSLGHPNRSKELGHCIIHPIPITIIKPRLSLDYVFQEATKTKKPKRRRGKLRQKTKQGRPHKTRIQNNTKLSNQTSSGEMLSNSMDGLDPHVAEGDVFSFVCDPSLQVEKAAQADEVKHQQKLQHLRKSTDKDPQLRTRQLTIDEEIRAVKANLVSSKYNLSRHSSKDGVVKLREQYEREVEMNVRNLSRLEEQCTILSQKLKGRKLNKKLFKF